MRFLELPEKLPAFVKVPPVLQVTRSACWQGLTAVMSGAADERSVALRPVRLVCATAGKGAGRGVIVPR